MEKIMRFGLFLILILSAGLASAETAMYSGEKTASAVICEDKCVITAVFVHADGTNEATVTLYDSATASTSNKIHEWIVKAGDKNGGYVLSTGRRTKSGLYVVLSGTGASYYIDFQ